jgi:plasmid replication initiation protein
MSELVVKDNALINASYSLSLVEQRLILLAIVATRQNDHEQAWDFWLGKPIRITAQSYINTFDVSRQTAYEVLKEACKTLFARQFSYVEPKAKGYMTKTTRWVSDIAYNNEMSAVEFTFAPAVLPLITRLEQHLTSYELQQIADLNSGYAVRLYELLISWRSKGKTPEIKLEQLKGKLGVEPHEYTRMDNFKRVVLEPAIKQVNQHTDITATYEQHKKGRIIEAFSFSFKQKKKLKDAKDLERDPNTADLFSGYTDKQLARVVHSKKFMADYNNLVSAQNPANQSSSAWVSHMVTWLKKDPSNFNKRSLEEYLTDEQASRF